MLGMGDSRQRSLRCIRTRHEPKTDPKGHRMKNRVNGAGERILFSAYPLLPVNENSAGGAEQVLWNLQSEMSARGYRTTVAACSDSDVSGQLFATGAPARGSLASAKSHEDCHAAKCLE